jgi:hypothetical protein
MVEAGKSAVASMSFLHSKGATFFYIASLKTTHP